MPELDDLDDDREGGNLRTDTGIILISGDKNSVNMVLDCNSVIKTMFGYEKHEILFEDLRKLIPKGLQAAHFKGVNQFMSVNDEPLRIINRDLFA